MSILAYYTPLTTMSFMPPPCMGYLTPPVQQWQYETYENRGCGGAGAGGRSRSLSVSDARRLKEREEARLKLEAERKRVKKEEKRRRERERWLRKEKDRSIDTPIAGVAGLADGMGYYPVEGYCTFWPVRVGRKKKVENAVDEKEATASEKPSRRWWGKWKCKCRFTASTPMRNDKPLPSLPTTSEKPTTSTVRENTTEARRKKQTLFDKQVLSYLRSPISKSQGATKRKNKNHVPGYERGYMELCA